MVFSNLRSGVFSTTVADPRRLTKSTWMTPTIKVLCMCKSKTIKALLLARRFARERELQGEGSLILRNQSIWNSA